MPRIRHAFVLAALVAAGVLSPAAVPIAAAARGGVPHAATPALAPTVSLAPGPTFPTASGTALVTTRGIATRLAVSVADTGLPPDTLLCEFVGALRPPVACALTLLGTPGNAVFATVPLNAVPATGTQLQVKVLATDQLVASAALP